MLVLNRRKGESVVIGHEIEVTVLEVRGDRIKLGFRGPADVPIHRAELEAKIAAECGELQPVGCTCGRW